MNRVQVEITLGSLFILITSVFILVYGFNEEKRMEETALAQRARSIEVGAGLYEQQCSRCHGTQGLGIPGLCPPLNDRYFFDDRLTDVGWSGTLEDYIVATASSGRLSSTRPQTYPGQGVPAMPSFSEHFGGPMRDDQIRAIADFVMNWEETAVLVEAPPVPKRRYGWCKYHQRAAPGRPCGRRRISRHARLHSLPYCCSYRSSLGSWG